MFSLSSREQLTKRQMAWVQDVEDTTRTGPAQDGMKSIQRSASPRELGGVDSLISLLAESKPAASPPDAIHLQIEKLRAEMVAMRQEIRAEIHSLSQRSGIDRLGALEKQISRLNTNIEESLSQLSGRSGVRTEVRSRMVPASSDFSALTTDCESGICVVDTAVPHEPARKFVPHFGEAHLTAPNSVCTLTDDADGITMALVVEIDDTCDSSSAVIYPFGSEDAGRFKPGQLELRIDDLDGDAIGTAVGIFQQSEGVSSIVLAEYHDTDGLPETWVDLSQSIPFRMSCDVQLTRA